MNSTIIPALRYRDAHAAIAWLKLVFGFTVQALYQHPDNTVAHAQLTLGGGMVMLGSVPATSTEYSQQVVQPEEVGGRSTQAICVIVCDATKHYQQALEAKAEIAQALTQMDHGGKAFSCRDPEGHLWSIGEYDPWATA